MKTTLLALTVLLYTATAGMARADGLPLPVEESQNGILSSGEDVRYLTASARGKTAVIAQDAAQSGVLGAEVLGGRFTVPLVSYDGTAGGLSGDGRTLVLIRPRARFPRKRTSFAVVDVIGRRPRLRLRELVHLRGDFSYDALSPDGRSLFLINYVSRRDPTKYRVRVFDLGRGELAPEAIVDPRESPDEMNGLPVSRVMSPDRRWAYTLYDGTEGHPFIHALDTVERRAACIDLDDLNGDPYRLRLKVVSDRSLAVRRGSRTAALVDTPSFEVRDPREAASGRSSARRGAVQWPMPTAVLALLGAVAIGARVRARAR